MESKLVQFDEIKFSTHI